jgi:hypothetical protein
MANREEDRRRRSVDGPEVVCEAEHGPVIGDGAEVRVERVRERAVVDELRADDGVLAGLVRRGHGVGRAVVRRAVLRVVASLLKLRRALELNLVGDYVARQQE